MAVVKCMMGTEVQDKLSIKVKSRRTRDRYVRLMTIIIAFNFL